MPRRRKKAESIHLRKEVDSASTLERGPVKIPASESDHQATETSEPGPPALNGRRHRRRRDKPQRSRAGPTPRKLDLGFLDFWAWVLAEWKRTVNAIAVIFAAAVATALLVGVVGLVLMVVAPHLQDVAVVCLTSAGTVVVSVLALIRKRRGPTHSSDDQEDS